MYYPIPKNVYHAYWIKVFFLSFWGFFIIWFERNVFEKYQTDFEDESQDKENESLDPVDKVVQFNLQPTYHEIKPGKPRCKSGKIERGPFKYMYYPSLSFTVCLCVCLFLWDVYSR